jgi:hypothetical protein
MADACNNVYRVDAAEALRFQVKRQVTTLFKSFLVVLEDLGLEHDEALKMLKDKLPESYKVYVELADHFTEEKEERLRSKILGTGNDCWRSIEEELKKYEIRFKV